MGGKVKVKERDQWIQSEEILPPNDFTVEAVDMSNITLTDRGLENLTLVPTIKDLDISGSLITAKSFPALSKIRTLTHLTIKNLKVTPTELKEGVDLIKKENPKCEIST